MHRVSNEMIWAAVAAIVCGVVIASLLGGAGTPWIVVAAVFVAGLALTTLKRLREVRGYRSPYEPLPREQPEPDRASTGARPAVPKPRVPASGATTIRDSSSPRRAGARSQSLGALPPRGKPPRR